MCEQSHRKTIVAPTWIIGCVKLNYEVAVTADHNDIAPFGVVPVDDGTVPGAWSFVEDVHVEAVEMHGVSKDLYQYI